MYNDIRNPFIDTIKPRHWLTLIKRGFTFILWGPKILILPGVVASKRFNTSRLDVLDLVMTEALHRVNR